MEEGIFTIINMEDQVLFYGGKWGCFSNMSSYAVEIDGVLYMTSEHAYQAAKFSDPELQQRIIAARSGFEAKMLSLEFDSFVPTNWNDIKLDVMEKILRAKLEQHPHIREKLLETGDRDIIEASPHDDFWGWGAEKNGQNMHGKLWMKLRSEIAK